MKKLKTLISVVLSAMLVLSLVVPAMASTAASTITVNGVSDQEAGEKYTAYQIFKLDYSGTNGVYTITTTALNLITEAKLTEYGFTVSSETDFASNKYVTVDTLVYNKEKAKAFADYLSTLDLSTLPNAEATSSIPTGESAPKAVIDVSSLGAGYYFVDTTIGSICMLDNTTPNATINEKHTDVTVQKVIVEGNSDKESSEVQIGDKVSFKTTMSIPTGSVKVVLHDMMDAGLTFNNDIVITGLTKDTDYTVKTSGFACTKGCDFEITFTDTWLTKAGRPTSVIVTYSATLNESAMVKASASDISNKNLNKTYATFGNMQETAIDETTITTGMLKFKKTDAANGSLLAGAQFNLMQGTNKIDLVKVSETEYRVAATSTEKSLTADDIITSISTGDGIITIKGLDPDLTYKLKETQAPEGYNKLSSDETATMYSTTNVTNSTGTMLPSTGGTGTKILFTVGGIMMVVAFVLFTSKRRMAAED